MTREVENCGNQQRHDAHEGCAGMPLPPLPASAYPPDSQPLPAPLGWWTIQGEELLRLLHEAHDGADPDLLYAETYANSDHEWVGGGQSDE